MTAPDDRRARALRPDLPIMFATGYADAEVLAGEVRRSGDRVVRLRHRPA